MPLTANAIHRSLLRDYLTDFVPAGGAAIKVVCGAEGDLATLSASLADSARSLGYATAAITASADRLHLVNVFLTAVTRQLPWEEAARRHASLILTDAGFETNPALRSLRALAEANDVLPIQIEQPIRRALRKHILQNPHYSRNLKHALLALVSGAMDIDGAGRSTFSAAQDWFRGDPIDLRRLRELHISTKIARNNSRSLLYELAIWFRAAGYCGIFIHCDATRYVRAGSDGTISTPGNAKDFYELLRQFIDNVGTASNLFVLVGTAPEFLTDERRGFRSYEALRLRLADDFYDTKHPNPLAPLTLIDGAA